MNFSRCYRNRSKVLYGFDPNIIIIEYNGKETDYKIVKGNDVPEDLLPTAGEYMEAEGDEYEEEIRIAAI